MKKCWVFRFFELACNNLSLYNEIIDIIIWQCCHFNSQICVFFKFNFIGVQLIYNVILVSGVWQNESVMHINTSILFPYLGYYKLLSRFSCAVQQVLFNYPFYTIVCICYSHFPNFSLPTPTVSSMITIRLVVESVSFCFLNEFFCIILLDSTCK